MIKKFFFIITLFLFTNAVNAEVVNKVQINGNERVSNETIKIYGNIEINKDYSEGDLNKILNNLFSTNFFEDVKIRISNGILIIDLVEFPVIRNCQENAIL